MSKRVLLTGGAGFIGAHTVEHILRNTDWNITVIDRLTYAGNLNRLASMECWPKERRRVTFKYHDFRAEFSGQLLEQMAADKYDYFIHMGGETHVTNSLKEPRLFAESNIIGTINILELAKIAKPEKIIYISTDEVYGSIQGDQLHKEGEPHKPSNPYSASKAGAEDFCYSYIRSFGTPIIFTNTMNNFGERQEPEKFVPKVLRAVMEQTSVDIHCKLGKRNKDGEAVIHDISTRCWLHARNHADALLFVLEHGTIGERYNIVGERRSVLEVARYIAAFARRPLITTYVDFHSHNPGHDMHYGLDGSKLGELGWHPPFDLESSLHKTIHWTLDHPEWL